ncbi:hypothetical protein ILUMI_12319 [Ignelater luminosus]|uniref:Gamma-secretase subunit PEN-2 n=1 Tax=Ignelater luminosus TaxID=2038154 RepID=A0A8K0CYE4_IGNLU|nr:hypothetical protein ILUMI_12319 [Ignelater luminosus]
MDLTKMTNDRKLYLCRWYFRAGFALLPFLWAVNSIWFFNEAFRKPEYDEQKQIKKYVIFSGIGTIIWTVIIVTWVVIFQVNRAHWGEFADDISFIIPLGTP